MFKWIKKHPIWSAIILIVLLAIIINPFISSDTSEKQTNNPSTPVINQTSDNVITKNITASKIKVANWNLQIFGDSKASKPELMSFYASTISNYDIIFIQEIRDADGSSFNELCSMLSNYDCKVSSRAGRSTSKEQYGIIYKKGITIEDFKDFNPDSQDRWERPPIEVTFKIGGYELTVYNIHTKPDDVSNELYNLESVVSNNGNDMIIGDLNADCSYYDNSKENQFNSWQWIIGDNADTTTSPTTNCAYDRIILNSYTYAEYYSYGIFKDGITSDVSDHYLVWVELSVNETIPNPNNKPIESNPVSVQQNNLTPEKQTSTSLQYDCSYDKYNCADFKTQSEAQNAFEYCKSLGKGDVYRLDRDGDGIVCESLG